MPCDINTFKYLLQTNKHYSEALVDLLIKKLDSNQITTFQEVNDLIYRDTNELIAHFANNPDDLDLIERKNPLCLESMRDYLVRLFRVVMKVCGQDVKKFVENLKIAFRNQIQVISTLTQKTAQAGFNLMMQHHFKSVLVYNYSKSILLALKQMSRQLGEGLEVYICSTGITGEGEKMYNELSLAQVNCSLIADTESGYYINEVDCIVTGAEVVLNDGSIINRTGTAMIALSAHQARKPVIVFAESYKFIKKTLLVQKDIPNYARYEKGKKEPTILTDLTKGKYINIFCTDVGLVSPQGVSLKISSLFS